MIQPHGSGPAEAPRWTQAAPMLRFARKQGVIMTDTDSAAPTRKVGILLGIGIFLLPIIFAWFTLRRGHSTLSRIVAFVWLGVTLLWSLLNLGLSANMAP